MGAKQVQLYTDGACSGNPGPGGWACILVDEQGERELYGFFAATTNSRMELMAVIEGLEVLAEPSQVHIVTDSKYVMEPFTKGWLAKWEQTGWTRSQGSAVRNCDLWKRLLTLSRRHHLTWEWVKGHSGHPFNTRCDRLARLALRG